MEGVWVGFRWRYATSRFHVDAVESREVMLSGSGLCRPFSISEWSPGVYGLDFPWIYFHGGSAEVWNGDGEGVGAVGVMGYMAGESGECSAYDAYLIALAVGGGDEVDGLIGLAEHELELLYLVVWYCSGWVSGACCGAVDHEA